MLPHTNKRYIRGASTDQLSKMCKQAKRYFPRSFCGPTKQTMWAAKGKCKDKGSSASRSPFLRKDVCQLYLCRQERANCPRQVSAPTGLWCVNSASRAPCHELCPTRGSALCGVRTQTTKATLPTRSNFYLQETRDPMQDACRDRKEVYRFQGHLPRPSITSLFQEGG